MIENVDPESPSDPVVKSSTCARRSRSPCPRYTITSLAHCCFQAHPHEDRIGKLRLHRVDVVPREQRHARHRDSARQKSEEAIVRALSVAMVILSARERDFLAVGAPTDTRNDVDSAWITTWYVDPLFYTIDREILLRPGGTESRSRHIGRANDRSTEGFGWDSLALQGECLTAALPYVSIDLCRSDGTDGHVDNRGGLRRGTSC